MNPDDLSRNLTDACRGVYATAFLRFNHERKAQLDLHKAHADVLKCRFSRDQGGRVTPSAKPA